MIVEKFEKIMAKNLKEIFMESEIEQLSKKFKLLSEPSRLKILRALFEGEKCVTEIIDATGLMQANVSKQLKIMQGNGILECRPEGLQRFYSVADNTVLDICNILCGRNPNDT